MSLIDQPVTANVGHYIEVLVDCPGIQGLYVYRVANGLQVKAGDIVSVPFGGQQRSAIAIRPLQQLDSTLTSEQVRPLSAVISSGFFSSRYWQLLEQVASYYQTPLIQVIRTALPPGLLAKSQRRIRLRANPPTDSARASLSPAAQQLLQSLEQSPAGDYTWHYLQRQQRGAYRALQQLLQQGWVESYLQPPQPPQPQLRQAVSLTTADAIASELTQRQREILTVLQRQGGDLWLSDALQRLRTTSATLKKLAAKGYLTIQPRELLRVSSHSTAAPDQPKRLTADQAAALSALSALTGYTKVLLHGVTGSGKTEVYLQAIAPRLATGRSILVLVPEIGLTPQLTDRFRSRFGEKVCVYHSALSDGERYDTWRQMLSGTPQVVIGTRSAVFAPLPQLGLIILDEEHDGSFKQDQPAPCYHARTVAEWRAQLADCPLILGSATPSLESWVAAGMGGETDQPIADTNQLAKSKILYLSLPERVHARPLPPVEIVDMRQELQLGNRSIFSQSLQQGLAQMKAAGGQGLLFIHRRGHSSFVSCRSCGYVVDCPNCDVSLSYHRPHQNAAPYLRCHYCGYGQVQPPHCPDCSSPYLKNFGSGTQRVVSELATQFPELSCIRFDSDTTRTKGAHRALLSRFAQGEADLLVGTQMLTKGIDLPQVTLVGVLAADGLLYMADYRASERAFQTLTQVAGRAGRGEERGRVILQTYTPEHPVIGAVQQHHYAAFVERELSDRRALTYPPYGRLVLLRVTGTDMSTVEKNAETLAHQLCQRIEPAWLLGPTPAPIMRVARRYRWHILLKLPAAVPPPVLTDLRQHCSADVSLTIDVDPINIS
ncbi:MAG: primosomal protein N' [Leptolyngbya sp. SIO4C1]|nr:primosomal protein N' [Leptolyngbya sp. SIO4C1]